MRPLTGEERGVTVIELLTVLVVIAVLAAIAIPSFFRYRDRASDAQA